MRFHSTRGKGTERLLSWQVFKPLTPTSSSAVPAEEWGVWLGSIWFLRALNNFSGSLRGWLCPGRPPAPHTHTAPFPHDQTIFANQDLLTPVPAENNTLVGIQGFYDKDQNPNWGALLCPHTQAFLWLLLKWGLCTSLWDITEPGCRDSVPPCVTYMSPRRFTPPRQAEA